MEKRNKRLLALEDISQYKNEIYGFSILWIMLFHAIAMLNLNYTLGYSFLEPFNMIIACGNMGVEIFLFCSGAFLYFSYTKNPNLLSFMKKRFSRLLWPVLVISGGYWVWSLFFENRKLAVFFSRLSLLDFWVSGDQQIWFVSFIFICYFLYPYVYTYLFESKSANIWVRLSLLLGVVAILTLALQEGNPAVYRKWEIALTRFPVFFLGCFAGKFIYEKKTLPGWSYGILFLIAAMGAYTTYQNVFHGALNRWSYMLIGLPVMFLFIGLLKFLQWDWVRRFFAFFGKISLNLYVSHVLMTRLYKLTPFYENKRLFHYLILLLISILVAWLAELLISVVRRRKTLVKS